MSPYSVLDKHRISTLFLQFLLASQVLHVYSAASQPFFGTTMWPRPLKIVTWLPARARARARSRLILISDAPIELVLKLQNHENGWHCSVHQSISQLQRHSSELLYEISSDNSHILVQAQQGGQRKRLLDGDWQVLPTWCLSNNHWWLTLQQTAISLVLHMDISMIFIFQHTVKQFF